MDDNGDMELGAEDDGITGSHSGGHSVKKQITIKLKPASGKNARLRNRKPRNNRQAIRNSQDDLLLEQAGSDNNMNMDQEVQLPAMKGPPEPLHRGHKLDWNHKVNLLGKKMVNPLIMCCEICFLPILIYGRMIPCKHVFCYDCANNTGNRCSRCEDPVQRIEQCALGSVYICNNGGSKYGVNGCRRTYLSQRDLQAHVAHRHQGEHPPRIGKSKTCQPLEPIKDHSTTSVHAQAAQQALHGISPSLTPSFPSPVLDVSRSLSSVSLATAVPINQQMPSPALSPMPGHVHQPQVMQPLPTQAMLQGPPPQVMSMTHMPPPSHGMAQNISQSAGLPPPNQMSMQVPPPVRGPPPNHMPPHQSNMVTGPPPQPLPQPQHIQNPLTSHPQGPPPPLQGAAPSQSPSTSIESYHTIPVKTSRTNLITVQIEEDRGYQRPEQRGFPPPLSQPPPGHYVPSAPPPQAGAPPLRYPPAPNTAIPVAAVPPYNSTGGTNIYSHPPPLSGPPPANQLNQLPPPPRTISGPMGPPPRVGSMPPASSHGPRPMHFNPDGRYSQAAGPGTRPQWTVPPPGGPPPGVQGQPRSGPPPGGLPPRGPPPPNSGGAPPAPRQYYQ